MKYEKSLQGNELLFSSMSQQVPRSYVNPITRLHEDADLDFSKKSVLQGAMYHVVNYNQAGKFEICVSSR